MNTGTTLEIKSSSSEDTYRLGEQLGKSCRGGELFLLASDLGGGKTTFTKGLAVGLGCKDPVTSPTFTVSNIYKCSNGELHHFDFYRLAEAGIMADDLAEILDEDDAVVAIEWGDVVEGVLPADRVEVKLEKTADSENHRSVKIIVPPAKTYLLEDLT